MEGRRKIGRRLRLALERQGRLWAPLTEVFGGGGSCAPVPALPTTDVDEGRSQGKENDDADDDDCDRGGWQASGLALLRIDHIRRIDDANDCR